MASVPAEVQNGAQLPATPPVPEQTPSPVEVGQEPANELIFGFSKLTLLRYSAAGHCIYKGQGKSGTRGDYE